jgi:PadR family transcriptional regulator AphA
MQLTTTSYAILGLLDLRDWTAYELAQQAERSLAFAWPVSETQLYAEPKRLAAEGLITITRAPAGPTRRRQMYAITDAGRAELRRWLATEPAPPRLQMELLLRTLLATAGTKQDLLAALRATRTAAQASFDAGQMIVSRYLEGDNPFPERLHANVLWMTFVRDFLRLLIDWADRAAEEVADWKDTQTGGDPERALALLRQLPG